jgi:hypothetical protein
VALTGDRIRLRVDIDVGDGAIAGFEGRLVYDHARLRVTDATGLQCDAVIRCPGGVSMTPHPFGDPVVELADGEVRFTVAAEGAAGTGIAGLLELAFDVMAHGAAIGELVSAGYTATPGGELLPARRGALDPLEIEARLVGRIVAASQDMASLFLLEPATSPVVRRIIPTPLAFHAWPAWSPDGERITFAGHPEPMHAMPDIYVMNADGSGLVNDPDLEAAPVAHVGDTGAIRRPGGDGAGFGDRRLQHRRLARLVPRRHLPGIHPGRHPPRGHCRWRRAPAPHHRPLPGLDLVVAGPGGTGPAPRGHVVAHRGTSSATKTSLCRSSIAK